MPEVETMSEAMGGDPITALMDRSRAELRALQAQIVASTTTLRSMEESLKSTQQQVVAAQERLSVLQREMRDGEAKAAKLLADARTQSGVLLAKANKEAKQLLDDAKAKVAAAARLLVSGDTAGAA